MDRTAKIIGIPRITHHTPPRCTARFSLSIPSIKPTNRSASCNAFHRWFDGKMDGGLDGGLGSVFCLEVQMEHSSGQPGRRPGLGGYQFKLARSRRGFDTFSWPQAPTLKQIRAVADAACALRALRRETMKKNDWSLRELYKTLETPGENKMRDAQDALDTAVRAVYGMKPTDDILAFLLKLNLELADKEKKGDPVTPPGLPPTVEKPEEFLTEDCVQPV
jgi:hypothetical protein